jgi:hypothetical protein
MTKAKIGIYKSVERPNQAKRPFWSMKGLLTLQAQWLAKGAEPRQGLRNFRLNLRGD